MERADIQLDKIEKQGCFGSIELIILKQSEKRSPESNLLIFNAESGVLLNRPNPPVSSKGQWDGYVNFYTKSGKLYVGSWSGYTYEINENTGQLINGIFTK
ncbi:hypothetical protein [Zooshikella ganghwensis]|uniref:Uncharacterized protein n=1 Tax=Zooshikella ganghwensis TaxID=202772 RepID=A0A4P9VK81_9GAMM|nr:hypothetical protein [Zooshikella ganghwensis]RDH43705.1 hypothetical protein B9G39_09780 [Zooshikella ganghwensis]